MKANIFGGELMDKNISEKAKNQSMKQHSDNSLNSDTGYKDTGNPAQVHGKARAIRNNDNGSHH
jgi:hypothetical protein